MIAVMPLLAALFIVCGLSGGYFVGVNLKGIDSGGYWSSLQANVVFDDDIVGSLEFASKVAGSKLIVVLGHTSCGAIKGAWEVLHVSKKHVAVIIGSRLAQ